MLSSKAKTILNDPVLIAERDACEAFLQISREAKGIRF